MVSADIRTRSMLKITLRQRLQVLYVIAVIVLSMSGYTAIKPDSFILKTDLPANFKITAEIRYKPATGETCTALLATRKRASPAWRRIESERQEVAHSVEMDIPLYERADGCPLVLSSIGFEIRGKWGPEARASSKDIAGISFVDTIEPAATSDSDNKIYSGECQWLFRTVGPQNHIIKLLKCRAIDSDGRVLNPLAGGYLERDKLRNKTVTIVFGLAKDEAPAVGNNWIKVPSGWKRCLGDGVDDLYGFCKGNVMDFRPFKLPDGRNCTVYPNCI